MSLPRSRRVGAALALAGVLSTAAAASTTAATTATTPAPAIRRTAATITPPRPVTPIDRLTNVARARYAVEVHGGVALGTLHRLARDPVLRQTLQSGNLGATRAYVQRQFPAVWYHWHVSRMRILKGSQVVAEAGVPFVVAPSQTMIRGAGGRPLATLQVSIQDEIGFVRFMHRNHPVDVVVRGQGTGHVRTSLPAAATARLPRSGPVTIAGRRYQASSFHETAWNGEPVTVWILSRA